MQLKVKDTDKNQHAEDGLDVEVIPLTQAW